MLQRILGHCILEEATESLIYTDVLQQTHAFHTKLELLSHIDLPEELLSLSLGQYGEVIEQPSYKFVGYTGVLTVALHTADEQMKRTDKDRQLLAIKYLTLGVEPIDNAKKELMKATLHDLIIFL